MDIKMRLLKLDRRQVDLLDALRRRGYPRIEHSNLSMYINHGGQSKHCVNVLAECDKILSEWENQPKANGA
ncbi:MAG: hypothetical protein RR956_07400 [Christensenella sp.]